MRRRWRERPAERDPETGKPKEPPPDTGRAERKQFIAAARAKAVMNHRRERGPLNAYLAAAAKHARIDWDRRQRVERIKQARTESIESMLSEPTVPGFIEQLAATDAVNHILDTVSLLLAATLRLRYLEEREVDEVASSLGLSKQQARFAIQKALKKARSVSLR